MNARTGESERSSSLWLEIITKTERRVFEFASGDDRGVVLGALPTVDMPLLAPEVEGVHCHFERNADRVYILPDAGALRVDGTAVSTMHALPASARVSVAGVELVVNVLREPPPVPNLSRPSSPPVGVDYLLRLPSGTAKTTAFQRFAAADDTAEASSQRNPRNLPYGVERHGKPTCLTLFARIGEVAKRRPVSVGLGTVLPGLVFAFLLAFIGASTSDAGTLPGTRASVKDDFKPTTAPAILRAPTSFSYPDRSADVCCAIPSLPDGEAIPVPNGESQASHLRETVLEARERNRRDRAPSRARAAR